MNTFLNELKNIDNITYTENGDITRKSTLSDVLDMFSFGGAYRNRSDEDVILLFKNAFEEDNLLALKCLFYLRDIRGGMGERRFFRVAFRWLCDNHYEIARRNLRNIAEFGRWDDLIYITYNTKCWPLATGIIKEQLNLDMSCKTPSLLAKWMPSENASNKETKKLARVLADYLWISHKEYRKMLSNLRAKIKIVETLMSQNRWDEIEFDKIPSRAGLIYRNAFARRDILAERYKNFAKSASTTVNAEALYPQDIAHRAFLMRKNVNDPERLMLQKYWDNLKDFYNGRDENGIAIVDVSGSMSGIPMEAAVSLGAYIADKAHGPFAHHFITFSGTPELVKFEGVDIVDKFNRCRKAHWGMNTDINAVFDLLLKTAKRSRVRPKDMPTRLYIFSDMEFDDCMTIDGWRRPQSEGDMKTSLEAIKEQWRQCGYELPSIIFWNLDARQNHIPAIGDGFSYVSGFSANMVDCILSGKDGVDLMLEKLNNERYSIITL